ncbi:uncharacterized protein EI97DRAFT_437297 [Westerdykella ornata]|uniref:Uncharacterized protein n=1 Tax=Westerdykella ornata TaxID=318751 RepID=A0A6A6J782_WESOR|nr:uncharacterized protein EI97DRAFT_437297 [Westerdykella ornata]KAF2272013.1 hypothetical protein EI97DRAFT_437297 [Westerdykella ornata]
MHTPRPHKSPFPSLPHPTQTASTPYPNRNYTYHSLFPPPPGRGKDTRHPPRPQWNPLSPQS